MSQRHKTHYTLERKGLRTNCTVLTAKKKKLRYFGIIIKVKSDFQLVNE